MSSQCVIDITLPLSLHQVYKNDIEYCVCVALNNSDLTLYILKLSDMEICKEADKQRKKPTNSMAQLITWQLHRD